MDKIPILYEDDIAALITPREAADAISGALIGGLDADADWRRQVLEARSGQLLLMPSETPTVVGVKAATVAPGNPARGLPRVHGAYLLFSADTLELLAIMDGATISNVRTPAVAVAGSRPAFERFDRPIAVTIFGAGPQAINHADAIRRGGFARLGDIVFVARDAERARRDLGPAETVMAAADPALDARIAASDVIVTVTTSHTPLFDSDLVSDTAVVMVVGVHEPHNREVDGRLMGRAQVVVEGRETALREAGDVVLAVAEGLLDPATVVPMADVLRGMAPVDHARPYVVKTTGMSWEDVAVAEVIYRNHLAAAGA